MEKTSQEWEKAKIEFKEWYFDNSKIFSLTKNMYQSLITSLLFDRNDISNPQIEGRVKDRKSCIDKFERKYLDGFESNVSIDNIKDKITDFVGIRIICYYEDEIEKIEKIIRENFEVLEKTDKTQELKNSNTFGYKGVHLDVKLSSERIKLDEYKTVSQFPVEIQIRTIIQHAWSSLDHKIIYKNERSPEITRAAERLAALFEIADSEFLRLRDETQKQEKISEEKIKASEDKTQKSSEIVSFITFKSFLNLKFPTYSFYEYRTNTILQEILRCDSSFSISQLTESFENEISIVEKYKQDNEKILSMNPYTMLRHILYSHNREVFSVLLTDLQKNNFDSFLKK